MQMDLTTQDGHVACELPNNLPGDGLPLDEDEEVLEVRRRSVPFFGCEPFNLGDCFERYDNRGEISIGPEQRYVFLRKDFLRGSGVREEDTVMFIRESCRDQIQYILERVIKRGREATILGRQGTGKSLACFAVAGTLAKDGWRVIWIHLDSRSDGHLGSRTGGTRTEVCQCVILSRWFKWEGVLLLQQLDAFLAKTARVEKEKILMVIDGYVEGNDGHESIFQTARRWWKKDLENRRLLFCSSMFFSQKALVVDCDSNYPDAQQWSPAVSEFTLASWTLSEYLEAVKDRQFAGFAMDYLDLGASPSFEDRVLCKYLFAGGCARFMFGLTTREVQHWIEISTRIQMSRELLQQGELGVIVDSSGTYSLQFAYVSQYEKRLEIASDYAWHRMALLTQPPECIRSISVGTFVRNNPQMKDWYFRMHFYSCIGSGKISLEHQGAGNKVVWRWSGGGAESVCLVDIPIRFDALCCGRDVWMIPHTYPAPFDAALYEPDDQQLCSEKTEIPRGTLRIVRLDSTTAKTKDEWILRNCQDLFSFPLSNLRVEICFIVPKSSLSEFRAPPCPTPMSILGIDF